MLILLSFWTTWKLSFAVVREPVLGCLALWWLFKNIYYVYLVLNFI
jgi:hypothetical protein